MKSYHVYILANARRGALYTGVTSDLIDRCSQHRSGIPNSYTSRYSIRHLVWFETHNDIDYAIRREKRIKRWTRAQKFDVIEQVNPDWRDLFHALGGADMQKCPILPASRSRNEQITRFWRPIDDA